MLALVLYSVNIATLKMLRANTLAEVGMIDALGVKIITALLEKLTLKISRINANEKDMG
jgi:hypothetical protein